MFENLGELGKAIETHIEESVGKIVAEMIEPVKLLKNYDAVEVLTLDEAVEILRSSKEKIRDACRRGELPHTALGRDVLFPKRLLAEYLLGTWKPEKKVRRKLPIPAKPLTPIEEKVLKFVAK